MSPVIKYKDYSEDYNGLFASKPRGPNGKKVGSSGSVALIESFESIIYYGKEAIFSPEY